MINKEVKTVDCKTNFCVPYREDMRYEVNYDGIMQIIDTFDQNGLLLYSTGRLVISKEAFILAYKTYIEGEKI